MIYVNDRKTRITGTPWSLMVDLMLAINSVLDYFRDSGLSDKYFFELLESGICQVAEEKFQIQEKQVLSVTEIRMQLEKLSHDADS